MKKLLLIFLLILISACAGTEHDKINIITGSEEMPVVIPPNCPNWTEYDSGVHNSSNFGCANRNNMGQMVKDPMDMVAGRGTNYYDGQKTSAAVSAYKNSAASSDAGASADSAGSLTGAVPQ